MKTFCVGIGFALLALCWGCAAQQDIVVLDDRLGALEQRMDEVQQRSITLESRLAEVLSQMDAYNQNRGQEDQALRDQAAGIRVTIDRLREEIQILNGLSEENRYLLKRKIKSLEDVEKKRDQVFEQIESQNILIKDRLVRLEEYLNLEYSEKSDAEKTTDAQAEKDLSENDLYGSAKQAFDKGDMEAAREEFQKFLKRYPKSGQADNAQFWIGEVYYREKWFEKSILEYQKVIENYPKGNKVPAALLKQGFAFLKLKDKANSRLILKELVKKYPGSKEAKIAGEKLKGI